MFFFSTTCFCLTPLRNNVKLSHLLCDKKHKAALCTIKKQNKTKKKTEADSYIELWKIKPGHFQVIPDRNV